jgi:hypothetical protein
MLTSRSLLLPLVLAAACGSKSSPSTPQAPMPTGPAPALTKQDVPDGDFPFAFSATGLPAVTNDAANVALAMMETSGPMAPPILTLSVRDRTDAEVHKIDVLTTEQGQAFEGGGQGETPPVFDDKPLVEANRYLTETHTQRGWFPLAAMTMEEPSAEEETEGPNMTKAARAGGVSLVWNEGATKVTVDGKVVVDRQHPEWLAESTPPPADCEDCGGCSNPSYLESAWIDVERKLIVARIAYIGNDSCWEPASEDHVIAWQ